MNALWLMVFRLSKRCINDKLVSLSNMIYDDDKKIFFFLFTIKYVMIFNFNLLNLSHKNKNVSESFILIIFFLHHSFYYTSLLYTIWYQFNYISTSISIFNLFNKTIKSSRSLNPMTNTMSNMHAILILSFFKHEITNRI